MSGGFVLEPQDADEGTTAEVIDLSGETSNCIQPTQLDFEIADSVCLQSLDKNPLMCGGFINEINLTTSCFEYTESGEWQEAEFSLISERSAATYVEVLDGQYWVLGGIEVCSKEERFRQL